MKHIIYIRTSTTDQTPENQLRDIESIKEEGVEYEVFSEQLSAWKKSLSRPEFNKIQSMIRKNQVKSLLVWDLDRIHRNRKRLVAFFQLCRVYKVTIRSVRQKWLDDVNAIPPPFDEIVRDLLIQIMGWMAEDESNKKSDRVKLAVTIKKGKAYSKYGNKWGRKSLSTFKQNQIKQYHEQGKSIRQIAELVGVSRGGVHKITQKLPLQKTINKGVNHLVK